MNVPTFLLILIIALTWARLLRPVHKTVEGNTLRVAALPLLAKIRMHSVLSLVALVFATVAVAIDTLTWSMLLLPILSTVLLLAIPVKYTITDQGIRLGWTGFRRWTEFAGVRRTRFGARLLGVHRKRGMNIWLSGSRGDDEFLHFLRQTQKYAYKGQFGIVPDAVSGGSSHATVSQPKIAAFTTIDGI
ncbi:MAG: hypothetical protein WKF81_13120 [Thermomicrobiales bacterium]